MERITRQLESLGNRYQVQHRIGTGGMAVVYKAYDKHLQRSVAIKVLHDHLAQQPAFRERFEREARIIAGLNHPNIVQIYDFTTHDADGHAMYCMMMPYIGGESLVDELERLSVQNKRMALPRVRQIILDLCAALTYAHERDMVHRDVKPANVLFDDNGRAILTDFGIARLVATSHLTQEGTILGTPAYMSPEQATGELVDHRSDLYSVAVILYELLAGQAPYTGDSGASVLVKHIQEPVPLISPLLSTPNPSLDAFIERALAKQPSHRFQSVSEMVGAFENAIKRQMQEASDPNTTSVLGEETTEEDVKTVVLPPPRSTDSIQTGLLQTITTGIVQPARQNPLALLALAVAIIALLLVARASQPAPTAAIATPAVMPIDTVTESMTGELFFVSTFDEEDEYITFWQLSTDSATQRILENDQLVIRSNQPRVATTTLFEPEYMYADAAVSMQATLLEESASASGYGIIFRYEDGDNYYVFAVDGEGRYSLWRRLPGRWQELRNADEQWTPNPAVNPSGEANRLRIEFDGTLLSGYINDQLVVQLQDDSLRSGAVGIYVASTRDANTIVTVDSYEVAMLATSMTDEENSTNAMTLDE